MRRATILGFTLIELLVVMTIIAMLLTLALPRYFSSVERSKEAVLRDNLSIMRESLDKYYGDHGKYPESLDDLVAKKYLRAIPQDPITGNATSWVTVPPDDPDKGAVFDIKSGAEETAQDGTPYAQW